MNCLMVFIGGGIGCLSRYLINGFFLRFIKTDFLYPTITVNILGSFILGFLFCIFLNKFNFSESYKLFFTAGFCGGLTTFSGFTLELFKLVQDGKMLNGFLYILVNIVFSFAAILLGMYLAKI